MTPDERRRLQALDDMILGASPDELECIQRLDRDTQLECLSFYDLYVDSAALVSGRGADGVGMAGRRGARINAGHRADY